MCAFSVRWEIIGLAKKFTLAIEHNTPQKNQPYQIQTEPNISLYTNYQWLKELGKINVLHQFISLACSPARAIAPCSIQNWM